MKFPPVASAGDADCPGYGPEEVFACASSHVNALDDTPRSSQHVNQHGILKIDVCGALDSGLIDFSRISNLES